MRTESQQYAGADSIWAIPLVRHLATIIVVKLAFLFLLWFLFFRQPSGSPEIGSDIHDHIAGPVAAGVAEQYE